jgi:hypothetical protein
MKKDDLKIRLVVGTEGNEEAAANTTWVLCTSYHSKFPNSQVVVKIFEEDHQLKKSLNNFFTYVDSSSGKGGDLFGLYQVRGKESATSRISFSPFRKLDLKFFMELEEMNTWQQLEFHSYKEVSSNINDSWQLVALTSESGKVDDFVKTAETNVIKRIPGFNISFKPTPLYGLFPSIQKFVSNNQWTTERIRGSRLLPGSKILRHTDPVKLEDNHNPTRRIHCVLSTNLHCHMSALDIRGNIHKVHLKKGEVWEIFNFLPHWVENYGSTNRDHLIFDVK